ncbi:MAG: hypothetical protein U0Q07_12425 [Acidimicrobiales bacterium]
MLDETVVLSLPEPDVAPPALTPGPLTAPVDPSAVGAPVASVTTAYAAHPAHGAAAVLPPAMGVDPTIDLGAVTTSIPVPLVPAAPAPYVAAPAAVDHRGRAVGLAFLGAFLGLVLLAGGIVFAVRGGDRQAALDAAAHGAPAGATGPGVAGAAGATILDPTGTGLGGDVELPAVATTEAPTTEAPADVTPVAPPVTVVISVPPTAPPTTAAPTTSTTAPPSTTTSTTPSQPPLSFATASVPSKVDCSNPAQQTPYITVSWNAPGAQSVTLAIDGPGAYRTYPGPSGMDTVPFSCPGPHTYRLTANGSGGQSVTKVFTATKKP